MPVTDPVDARLLSALADEGKTAVHELASKLGMDPREVAYRLVALSGSGLPLLVGVESDPQGLRTALAASGFARPDAQQQPSGPHSVQAQPSGPNPVQGTPSGQYSPPHGMPAGGYPGPTGPGGAPMSPMGTAGQHQQGMPSGPHPPPPGHGFQPTSGQVARGQPYPGHTQGQFPPPAQSQPAQPPMQPDPIASTWGPPQSSSWARGDQDQPSRETGEGGKGKIGDTLPTSGLEGEQLTIQLLEVQDPADYLFSAAGYRLDEGERSVVVHTEITNRGTIPYVSLPDNYLELLAADGGVIGKAPVSLTSRPPHRIGVKPGETTGGHTVYVLPESTRVVSVRWSPRPEPDGRSLTWLIDN